jgi:hypothetical protein
MAIAFLSVRQRQMPPLLHLTRRRCVPELLPKRFRQSRFRPRTASRHFFIGTRGIPVLNHGQKAHIYERKDAMKKDQAPPMPDDKSTIASSGGEKSVRETGTRPFTVDLTKPDGKEQAPLQPNDRDEMAGGTQSSGPREVMKQAYKDVEQGQVDTDLREQRGVEATVDKPFTPAQSMPQKKHGRT